MGRSGHQTSCKPWEFKCLESFYNCNVEYAVAAVCKRSDLGTVAPLVGISYSNEYRFVLDIMPVNIDLLFFG